MHTAAKSNAAAINERAALKPNEPMSPEADDCAAKAPPQISAVTRSMSVPFMLLFFILHLERSEKF